jgi:hypothetical protein
MKDVWYLAQQQKVVGPLSSSQLKTRADSRELAPEALLWQEGTPSWVKAETLDWLFPVHQPVIPQAIPLSTPPSVPPPSLKLGIAIVGMGLGAIGVVTLIILAAGGGGRPRGSGDSTDAARHTPHSGDHQKADDMSRTSSPSGKAEQPDLAGGGESKATRARKLLGKAAHAALHEDYAGAILHATEALELDAGLADAYWVRGHAYFMLGNLANPINIIQCEKGVNDFLKGSVGNDAHFEGG